jgi:hypothetical protein
MFTSKEATTAAGGKGKEKKAKNEKEKNAIERKGQEERRANT